MWTDEQQAEYRRRYEEIRDKHPELVTELFECRVGWFPILQRLFDEVAFILQDGDPAKFELRQVKEKIGGLRVYWRYGDHTKQATLDSQSVRDADIRHRITLAVFEAEARSERTCEVCGRPGLARFQSGWWSTRCDEHGSGMEVKPPADEQAAFKPQLKFPDGRMFIFDPDADKAVEVRGS